MKRRIQRRWRLFTTSLVVAVGGLAAAGIAATSDPITAARYVITIDGYEIASFNELTAINSEIETADFWETSGDQVQVNKLPGKFKAPTVTLKRPMNGSLELWSWHEAVRQGNMAAARKSLSLTMFSSEGKPVVKYWLEKAWPSKLEVGALKAGKTEALTESVTLTAEYIQRVAP